MRPVLFMPSPITSHTAMSSGEVRPIPTVSGRLQCGLGPVDEGCESLSRPGATEVLLDDPRLQRYELRLRHPLRRDFGVQGRQTAATLLWNGNRNRQCTRRNTELHRWRA